MRVWSRITMSVLMSFELKIRKIKLKHKNCVVCAFVCVCVYISGVNGVIFSLRFLWFLHKLLYSNASVVVVVTLTFSLRLYLNKYMGNVGVFVFPFRRCVSNCLFANTKRSWLKRYFFGYVLKVPPCNLHALEVVKCLVRTLFAQVSL